MMKRRKTVRRHEGVNRDRIWKRMWHNIYAKIPAAEWAGEEIEVCPEEDLPNLFPDLELDLEF